jgi:hypothetical protein
MCHWYVAANALLVVVVVPLKIFLLVVSVVDRVVQQSTLLYSAVHDCAVLWLEYSTPVQYSSTGNSEGKTHH